MSEIKGLEGVTIQQQSKDPISETQINRFAQFLAIAKNPSSGKNYDFIYPNLYGRKYKSHIILYEVLGDNEIEVIRVLHERMDIPNRMIDE